MFQYYLDSTLVLITIEGGEEEKTKKNIKKTKKKVKRTK